MRSTKATRWLSGTLAALLLAQGMCLPAGAWSWGGWGNWGSSSQTSQVETLGETQTVQLQNGTAIIPADADEAAVKQALYDALVVDKEGLNAGGMSWEFYGTSESDPWGGGNESRWVSVLNGGSWESRKGIFNYKYSYEVKPLAQLGDGDYQVRLAGTTAEVTLTKQAKGTSSITLNKGVSVALPYDENAQVDYDALRAAIFENVVASKTPEDLSVDDVTIEYYATATTGAVGDLGKNWAPLAGGKVNSLTYPAISVGKQQIRISYAESGIYYGTSAETTVTIAERPAADIQVNENPTVQLTVDENLKLNVNKLYQDMFNAIIKSSDAELTLDDVEITYYARNYVVDPNVPGASYEWMPLEGGTKTVVGVPLTFPAIPTGTQKVRIYWPGNQQYAPTTIEATVEVKDREQVQFNLNDGPYEVGMKFTDDQAYDYSVTAQAIYNAVVASTTPEVDFSQVTLEFSKTGANFEPLDQTNFWTSFGVGEWKIRISVADTQAYRGNSITVDVKTTDNRLASAVALKSGASFTYNMDASAMKQAIFDNVIDWDNSTLPAKETLSLNNFVIEYYGKVILFDGGIDSEIEGWAPIEGKSYDLGDLNLGTYPQMGAGENQSIRISYKGNADYRPSETTEGTVTVNKAKVSVKVNSTNIYADEQLPANFITTDPADEFDIYTIYAGVTSSVSTGVYLDLPDRYTNSAVLKLLDPIVEKLYGKSFTQMMNDGVTVGELRELFSTQELLDLLDKLNIDTGTFGQILNVINKLPGVMDSVRIGFGTPNRAGLYTVTAVTDSKNYETGVGFGFLLTKMHFSGPKLTWNQEINGGKLTAAEAQNFDFDATLYYDGLPVEDQSSVHYLYSGFTSSWRVYSSTTTAPTEPGRYVVTVCILGGNYMAAPITRSFQITK